MRFHVRATISVEAMVTADSDEEAQEAFEMLSGSDWEPTTERPEIAWETMTDEEDSE